MKVSVSWLQTYFKEPLPAPEKIAELFTFHSFEVEGIEKTEKDTVLDVKILPDRAHYALSHKGVAMELSVILGILKHDVIPEVVSKTTNNDIAITIEDPKLCRRYIGRVIENVSVTESPDWLKERLLSIGQRSINSIVDATNYIMFDIGQPLHAFDKDKIVGNIVIRKAKEKEEMDTLDNRTLFLNHDMLVIADDKGPLALAGVKGGIRAQVTAETKNILLESANFNPSSIRITSAKMLIRTESSKRFENEITPELAEEGMARLSALIKELSYECTAGSVVDIYPSPVKLRNISMQLSFISSVLGIDVPEHESIDILKRFGIVVDKKTNDMVFTIPAERLDLVIPEDIVEEVGRIYGYEKIVPLLPKKMEQVPPINKLFYYTEKIRSLLMEVGFSEVYLYSLVNKGDIEIANPLASDKNFLRNNLTRGINESLEFNLKYADVLGLQEIKIFEIGKIFTKEGERTSLSLGIGRIKSFKTKNKEHQEIMEVLSKLSTDICTDFKGVFNTSQNIVEVDIEKVIESLPQAIAWDIKIEGLPDIRYKSISPYPFAVRDIAVFVPENIDEIAVREIIEKYAGKLLVRNSLFDIFKKQMPDGITKTSYAFRLVLQSFEKTLTEEEINAIMQSITHTMNNRPGWIVR